MNTRQEKVMNRFLIVTGAIEAGAGLALLFMPSTFVRLLLGTDISGAAILLARLVSAALLALGAACWLARSDAQSRTARGLVAAMLVYNVGAAVVLGGAGAQSQTAGIVLWLAVALHAAMAVWCVALVLSRPAR